MSHPDFSRVFVLCVIAWVTAGYGAAAESVEGAGPAVTILIAHRGASAYAPEHTLAAYQLALDQGADFIEPDLQITKDGVLIALHDETLERTTNVREVFPERFRVHDKGISMPRKWHANDFTLEEVKLLDAGSWFAPEFSGERVPTLAEVIELVRGRAGIYPETKVPDVYSGLGFGIERLLVSELERYGLDRRGAEPSTPIVIQSFSAESLHILRNELGSDLPLTFLVRSGDAAEWTSLEGLKRISEFASGIGPAKNVLAEDPLIVERAHAAGLLVTPWTFRASGPGEYQELREEMTHFLCVMGVDGLFTNNPDIFPRRASCK